MRSSIGPKVSEESIEKPPSRLGLAVGLLILAAVGGFALTAGGADSSESGDPEAEIERSIEPVPTIMTLANGPDTAARENQPPEQTEPIASADEKMPDRGAFRAALAARLISSCDGLIDGPEPVPSGLYREHGRCVSEALVGLDERCKLAAAVFYVLPGEEALDIACDIRAEPQRFRESVRQSMALSCEMQQSITDPHHEAYHEYDRCLRAIDSELDQTCYLAARAQYVVPNDHQLRTVCDIAEGIELAASIE